MHFMSIKLGIMNTLSVAFKMEGRGMIKETIAKLVAGENLREEEMTSAMGEIMEGAATPAQIASTTCSA